MPSLPSQLPQLTVSITETTGLPVQVGLYTALVPMLVYVLLGTSRPLSVSSTSTISMLTATELARVAQGGDPADYVVAASTLALLVGAFLLLAGLLAAAIILLLRHRRGESRVWMGPVGAGLLWFVFAVA